MKRILYIICSVLLTLGCSKDIDLQSNDKVTTLLDGEYRISACIDSDATRISLYDTIVTWSEDDCIYVAEMGDDGTFNSISEFTIDSESISNDGKSADFCGAILEADKEYVAVQSRTVYHVEDSEYYQSLGLVGSLYMNCGNGDIEGDGDDSNVEARWCLMSAPFTVKEGSVPSVSFANISSCIKLNISMEEGAESCEIKEITLRAPRSMFNKELFFDSNCDLIYTYNTYYISSSFQEYPTLSSSNDYTLYLSFAPNEEITEVNGNFTVTIYTSDAKESSVTIPTKVLSSGTLYTKDLQFPTPIDMAARDRAALIDLYNATDGDNWTNNTNWCTDAPLSEWYGIYADISSGRVENVWLGSNNLTGSIPESIGDITEAGWINLSCNNLTGSIPESISDISGLVRLELSQNYSITGSIPESIGDIASLAYLDLSYCCFSGSIPESINNLLNLTDIYLKSNNLTGSIPESLFSVNWSKTAWNILGQDDGYGFTSSIPDVYLEPSTVTTIEGKTINTQDFFSYNELTCVIMWRSWCWFSTYYMETIKDLYNTYASKGFGLISLNDEEDLTTITDYVSSYNIPGHVCQLSGSDFSDGTNRIKYMPTSSSPTYAFVDSEGKVVFSESIYPFSYIYRDEYTRAFVEEYLGVSSAEKYESTDYSADGDVLTLQTATVGDGIDLVVVGDGFIDTDMESGGVYETRMSEAVEHFFSEEPFTSYRDRYNVYAVKAVSKNEGITSASETVFSAQFDGDTAISGNDSKVFEYALKVPSITTTEDLTVIAVLKSSNYAGTCYMYTDDSAVAYCPIVGYDDEQFRQIVTHEAGGHGFAKLLDEYDYVGTITSDFIDYFEWQKSIGWGANTDVTDDPDAIQWAQLLADSRYAGLVGIYEGALTFQYGAYRPTDNSIMRYNTGGYNPPSRKEIYRRIMDLSGGSYDYEEFVAYDAINRSASSQAYSTAQTRSVDKASFVPLARPVVIEGAPKVSK